MLISISEYTNFLHEIQEKNGLGMRFLPGKLQESKYPYGFKRI